MNPAQYLSLKGFRWEEAKRPSGRIAIMQCPSCQNKKKSFAVSLENGAFNCLRLNNCGIKGSWWDLQRLLGDKPVSMDSDNKIYRAEKKTYQMPVTKPDALKDDGYRFLIDRGFNKSTIEKFKIGQKNGDIMLPTFKDGKNVAIKYRSIREKKFRNEKGTGPYLFNRDNCAGEAIAICEGHFDCMALDQYGIPAVSVPNGVGDSSWIELEWEYLEKFEKIYLFFDSDTAGQDAVKEVVSRIGQYRCYSVTLPYKDANECLLKGIDKDQIKECVGNATEFNPERLKTFKDYIDAIFERRADPKKLMGIPTPWQGLNKLLKGWRGCELTIWSGRNSSGKSTILNSVIINLLNKSERVIVASLEMIVEAYLDWMLTTVSENASLSKDDMLIYAREKFDNLFIYDYHGDADPEELVNVFDFAARKYGVKHFIIDSLMKIKLPLQDKYEAQKDFCNMIIDKLAVKHNGHVHLVAHPRKGYKDNERPDKVDISGSSDITNLAHNVLMMYRTTEEEKEKAEKNHVVLADNELYVKKNRQWGFEGSVMFSFDSDTKRFIER